MVTKNNPLVKFSSVIHLSTSRTADPLAAGIERFVGLEHIEPENLHIRSWGNVADGTTFTSHFKPGQVLFGKRRAYQRKVAVADFDGVCSSDIYVFESKDPNVLLPELVPFILQSEGFFEYAVKTSAGSLSPRTNWSHLANYEFPLPPVDEQRRIADLLWAADDQLQALKEAMAKHDTLLKSFILDEYKSAIANYPKTTVDKLGEILMGRQKAPKYNKGVNPRPFLKVINIGNLEIDLSELEEMDFSEREVARYKLLKGDILLTEGDLISRFNVGRAAIFNGEVQDCCFQNTLIRFRCNSNMLPFYTLILFEGARLTGALAQVAKSTTVTHLGVGRFSTLEIPVAPLDVQKEAEKKFQELLSTRKVMRTHHEHSINLAKKLIKENLN
jgi:type I restriction enzyme S subunit